MANMGNYDENVEHLEEATERDIKVLSDFLKSKSVIYEENEYSKFVLGNVILYDDAHKGVVEHSYNIDLDNLLTMTGKSGKEYPVAIRKPINKVMNFEMSRPRSPMDFFINVTGAKVPVSKYVVAQDITDGLKITQLKASFRLNNESAHDYLIKADELHGKYAPAEIAFMSAIALSDYANISLLVFENKDKRPILLKDTNGKEKEIDIWVCIYIGGNIIDTNSMVAAGDACGYLKFISSTYDLVLEEEITAINWEDPISDDVLKVINSLRRS